MKGRYQLHHWYYAGQVFDLDPKRMQEMLSDIGILKQKLDLAVEALTYYSKLAIHENKSEQDSYFTYRDEEEVKRAREALNQIIIPEVLRGKHQDSGQASE